MRKSHKEALRGSGGGWKCLNFAIIIFALTQLSR
jgi:hypothetical protein